MKFMSIIFKSFVLSLILIGHVEIGYAQTASILPPAKTTFLDNNGKPLVGGKIDFYVPGTTTRKLTWQDAGQTIPNANPVTLDSAGRGIILGDGSYRQVVKDKYGNVIWDLTTSSTGSGGGGTTPTVGDGDAVGMVKAWSGMIAPYGYVFAYGQEFVRTSYPEAFAVLTNQQNVSCTSGSPTLTGVGATTQLPIGASIESSCLNAGATIISKTTSTVTASSNAIISTTTTARFFPFGNGDGSLTFNVPDLRGRVIAGNDIMGGIAANRLTSTYFGVSADALGASSTTLDHYSIARSDLPNVAPTFAGTPATINVTQNDGYSPVNPTDNTLLTASGGATVGGIVPTTPGVSVKHIASSGSYTPGGTVQSLNGNVTQTNITLVQPTQTQNYIIKVIPDSNPNSFFGVASIGGMYGVLTCGVGITCAGNTISAVNSTVPTPTSITLGGVFSVTCSSSNWIRILDNTGTFGCSQPLFTDIVGTLATNKGGTGQTSFTSNLPLIGNGASAIAQGTVSGNTTKFATVNGSFTSGNCLKTDANGNLIDNGSPCAASAGNNVQTIVDYATLRAGSPSPSTVTVFVQGRASSTEQGSGLFTLDTTDITSTDNDGTILVDAGGNRWKRQYNDGVYVDWFNFTTANTGAANTAAINNAISALPRFGGGPTGALGGKLVFPMSGTYLYAGFSVDEAAGLRITSAGGAILNPILKCTLMTGSCITARSSFDTTMEYLDLRFATANSTAYLVDLRHKPAGSVDTQGFYFFRSTMNGIDTLSGGFYTGFGFNLDQSSSTIIEGSKFFALAHAIDGQNPAGGSYSNEVRISHSAFSDIEGFPLNYLGDHWVLSDSYFQASHNGTGAVAFSNNTTSFNSFTLRDVSVYDTTTGGSSFLTLGTGKKLTIIGGYWGGVATSNLLIANGVINGVYINTLATNFAAVAYANITGQTNWIFAGSNVTGSTLLVGNPTNVASLNTDGVVPTFSRGVFSTTGYRYNPDGTIEQWGQISGTIAVGANTISFPISFPSACFNTQAILQSPGTVTNVLSLTGSCTTTGQTIYMNGTGVSSLSWRAIGR